MDIDPRLHPVRADLAADYLQGRITAPEWRTGTPAQIIVPAARLCKTPDPAAQTETTLLYGATVRIYDTDNHYAWVQADHDDYVGYIPKHALGPVTQATHWLAVRHSHLYAGPDLKQPPLLSLGWGARVAIAADAVAEKGFLPLANGAGWIWQRHLVQMSMRFANHMAIARQFLGTPYIWGGCDSSQGIDCSALVQIALAACGLRLPRDSDQQRCGDWHLGDWARCPLVSPAPQIESDGAMNGFKVGDIVFFAGHVGFMDQGGMLLHANASHMRVALDLLHQVVYTPCGRTKLPILAVRRPLLFGGQEQNI